MLTDNEQLNKLNLGTNEKLCIMFISATLPEYF
jgi:hypothetical protein